VAEEEPQSAEDVLMAEGAAGQAAEQEGLQRTCLVQIHRHLR
jgi:hypothetical protein